LANVYFPKGSGPNRDNSRIPFKLNFYRRLFKLLAQEKDRGERVMVLGDFNTAHREIDLARPKQNVMNSGFRPEERRELDRWLKSGWVDTFRRFDSRTGQYTWWSNRAGA
jgi:exodeoxyribonuclease-3